ncbi:MAG: 2OG-Fe(II) oxygenase, partial [Candidatus Brocadiales bacterium]|nr:2OG-Fe(II) oxygenase [Candidatus Bathyanammoxibius sp.]
FFPTLVQLSEVEDLAEMNKSLLPAIEEIKRTIPNSMPEDWSTNHYSTIFSGFSVIDFEGFEALRAFIVAEAINFANVLELEIEKHPLILTQSWVNVHTKDESQEPHVHQNSVISGVYHVKTPKKCGDLFLHSPYQYVMLNPPVKAQNEFNQRNVHITPKEGRLVLFRSFVEHSVRPNKSDQERISISINFAM